MKINVKHITKLANLHPDDAFAKKLEEQLEATLEHIERLKEIDTSKVQGTNEVTNLKNVAREDTVVSSLSQEEALKNAKRVYNGFFVVPVIIEEAVE